MRRFILIPSIILFSLLLISCQTQDDTVINEDKQTIYTSIYPLEFLAQSIAGNEMNVISILPPGVDSHSYEPTTKEIAAIARGDLLIYMGEAMESYAGKVEHTLRNSDVSFLKMSKDDTLFETNHSTDVHDPHIWLDPLKMIEMGKMIRDQFILLDEANKEAYENNFATLEKELTSLDASFTNELAHKKNKQILVSHAAYAAWEERYGIEQIPIRGLFNDEPSQKELARITKIAKESNLTYIIFEQTGPDRLAEIVQEQLNLTPLVIHNLETRTEKEITDNLNYIDLMNDNLTVLQKATK